MDWENDERYSVNSYRECFEDKLKPKNKYNTTQYQSFYDDFFGNGGYTFLVKLEEMFDECSSICKPSLFYLTRPISKGMPKKECLKAALDDAASRAETIANLLMTVAVFGLLCMPLAFPLCQNYVKEEEEESTKKVYNDDESGSENEEEKNSG